MKLLYPSFAPPEKWRDSTQKKKLESEDWRLLREKILKRYNYECAYCQYRSEKYQIVDHINGDPKDNNIENLQVICQMCNLIKHSGQGCVIQNVVDLYKKSKFNQNEVIKLTRLLRDQGKKDIDIISYLDLKYQVQFQMDKNYLKGLIGFITSRWSNSEMYNNWLKYHNKTKANNNQKLSEFE